MAKRPPTLVKPTLDKDLDKVTYVEQASLFVGRGLAPAGIGLVFLIVMTLFAGALASGQPGGLIVVAAATLGVYMAMNIGANDVTNNVGAAVGARAISLAAALAMAAVFEIAGAVIAGGDVVRTISSSLLDGTDIIQHPYQMSFTMLSALLAAALWINIATWSGWPVSTTHSIVGAVMGAGIAAAGPSAVDWSTIAGITTSWVVSPVLGGIIAASILWFVKTAIIYQEDKITAARTWVPVLIGVMTGAFACYLTVKGVGQVYPLYPLTMSDALTLGVTIGLASWLVSIPLVARQSIGLDNRNQSLRVLFRMPLIMSAALLSFAHGANDVSNAIGPVTAVVNALGAEGPVTGVSPPHWIIWIGALGISAGLLLFGPKLIRIVGEQITRLNPMRAYCVALSAALTVIGASWLGLPVSSTHIAIGSVFGVGLVREWYTRNSRRRLAYIQSKARNWEVEDSRDSNPDERHRRKLVRRSHLMSMLAAWVVTLPCSAGLATLINFVMLAIFVR